MMNRQMKAQNCILSIKYKYYENNS